MASLPPPPQTPVHRHSQYAANRRPRPAPQNRRKSAPGHAHTLSSTAASSPEVINSLVDSLSKLGPSPLQNPSLYGSLSPPVNLYDDESREYTNELLHPDDAALPPVVRTSKPPSGYSAHTSNPSSRRTSGISIGQGGVDIPSYVRNYMNRAAGAGDSHSIGFDRRSSRESSLSGSSGGRNCGGRRESRRLSYKSSRERERNEKSREREREKDPERECELRVSAAGPADLTGNGREDLAKPIPIRTSSHGKTSHHPTARVSAYSTGGFTSSPPQLSPFGSPRSVPATYTWEEIDDAAPAPDLPRSKPDRERRHSRNSKQYPRRSDSLPPAQRPLPLPRTVSMPVSTSPRAKHMSEPQGLFTPEEPHSPPPRPSFHSTPETRHSNHAEHTHHQRPSSADSIDDAVDAYLCSPRLSQKIRMPSTGRVISFSEVGDPQGFAVFVCVGMGLTRYITAFYDELALTLGLRLITPDRPGVGDSEPVEEDGRTVLSWPDDVLYICQALKITKFSILAHSAGAIYALATALRMPGHIRGKVHLLAPWIPPSQMEMASRGPAEEGQKIASVPTSQRILRALPTPILKVANSPFMSATSSSLTTSLPRTGKKSRRRAVTPAPKDKTPRKERAENHVAALDESPTSDKENESPPPLSPEDKVLAAAISSIAEKERQVTYDERLTGAIWTLSTKNANPAVDLIICLERTRPVGFRYVDITRAVVLHHGTKDTRVPVANVQWLGEKMKRAEVRILEGEGHGLMASAKVMAEVLEEIATEWKDWRKVVEGKQLEGGASQRRWAD